jgi:hypothetical protein
VAAGFFHAGTVVLRRPSVLFLIEHRTPAGAPCRDTAHPAGQWVTQQARNLMMNPGGHPDGSRFLIRDRDATFTAAFDGVHAAAGTQIIKTPARAPRANAIAERQIASARRQCPDPMLITGERHPRLVLDQYTGHYNVHRPHTAPQQAPPAGHRYPSALGADARLLHRHRLGGLTHEYSQAA